MTLGRRALASVCAWALVSACKAPVRQSGAVQLAVLDTIRGIQPGYSLAFSEGQVSGVVFESVAERDSLGQAIPWLAKRWTSPDSLMWTFTLHRGVTFHDGTPLRATDVVRSWTALVMDSTDGDEPPHAFMLLRGAAEARAGTAKNIDGLKAVDDTTLRLELIRREPGLPRTLGSRRLGVMGLRSRRWAPIGTGPWRFIARERADSILHFARWDRYWSVPARAESLLVRVVARPALASVFAAGMIDCANDLSDDEAAGLVGSRALRLIPDLATVRTRILLNFGNPALRDIRVRRALLLALDRATLLRTGGIYSAVLSDSPVPPSLMSDSATPPTPYDPDSARRLLAAAGYSESRPLRLRVPASLRQRGNSVLTAYWNVIGVRTDSTGASADESSRSGPIADVNVWVEEPGITTAEEYLNLIAVEGPYAAFPKSLTWNSPVFRSHYLLARTTRSAAVRDVAVRAMTRLAYDSLPSLPLFFSGSLRAESLRVSDCDERMPRYGTSMVRR